MDISFLSPGFLLLLLGIPALWFFPRRVTNVTQAILRSVLFASVVLALSRPVLLTADQALFQVLIFDRSDSISVARKAQGLAMAQAWARQIKDKEKSTLVLINGAQEQSGSEAEGISSILANVGGVMHIDSSSAASASSLSAALVTAQRQIPEGSPGVVTLVSDGLSTDHRWGPVIQTLIQRGIAVNTVDLGRNETDLYPAGIRTQPVLRVGQTTRIEVPVVGKTSGIQVRLLDEQGGQLAISDVVSSQGRVRVPLEFEPPAEGYLNVRAEVLDATGADSDATNNVFEATLAIQAPIRMLYLGGRMRNGADRLQELLGRGFAIDDDSSADLSNTTAADLANYDLIMVDDRSVSLMPERFQQLLSNAVQKHGVGLMFSGGKSSFGTGGYDQSTLAQALPVEFKQYTEKRDPSTGLALVIDTSGSMGGMRMEIARQIARLAVKRLKPHDRVGIVEFYGNKQWALPMQSASNKLAIDRALARLEATGSTVLYPAVEEAYYGLKNVVTRYKHILIITDSQIESANFEALTRRIAKDKVNVSSVVVGSLTASPVMEDLAVWGQGQYYQAFDAHALPDLVLKQPSTMKLPAYKAGLFPVDIRGGEGWWGRIDRHAIPDLSGYVETKAKPGVEVLMEVAGNSHPVLATWQYGLGRVTALMTEPVGEGTQSWRHWRDYGRMLARIATRTADAGRPFHYTIAREDHRVIVTARRLIDAPTVLPQAILHDAHGVERGTLDFRQQTPEIFIAETIAAPTEEVRVSANNKNMSQQEASDIDTRLVSVAYEDVMSEKQVDTELALDMFGLANATAGTQLDPVNPGQASFVGSASEARTALTLAKLWPYFLLLALLLYLAELVYRRWPAARV